MLLLVIAGLAVMLSALAYGGVYVNVPYPEPTPEQAASQAHHDLVFERLFVLGLAMSLVGAAGMAVARTQQRRRRRRVRPSG